MYITGQASVSDAVPFAACAQYLNLGISQKAAYDLVAGTCSGSDIESLLLQQPFCLPASARFGRSRIAAGISTALVLGPTTPSTSRPWAFESTNRTECLGAEAAVYRTTVKAQLIKHLLQYFHLTSLLPFLKVTVRGVVAAGGGVWLSSSLI